MLDVRGGGDVQALKIPAGETCRMLGRVENAEFSKFAAPITPTNPQGAGVAITYRDGDVCDPTAR